MARELVWMARDFVYMYANSRFWFSLDSAHYSDSLDFLERLFLCTRCVFLWGGSCEFGQTQIVPCMAQLFNGPSARGIAFLMGSWFPRKSIGSMRFFW